MDKELLKKVIISECHIIFEEYNDLLGITIDPSEVTIDFSLHGVVAGKACYSKRILKFNLLFAEENFSEFIEHTIPHEIAHLYQKKIYPSSKSHGLEWQRIMILGKHEPSRCHNYNTKNINPYVYQCENCGEELYLTKRKHNNMLRYKFQNSTYYSHKPCGRKLGKLKFIKENKL